MQNPLAWLIYRHLTQQPALKLNQLFMLVKEDLDALSENEPDFLLRLFHDNFVLMNALYELQRFGQQQGLFYLAIESLWIRLQPAAHSDAQQLADGSSATMAAYYLNWDNLSQTDAEQVAEYLRSFGQVFYRQDNQSECLALLNCQAGASWAEVKQSYKSLSLTHHPDRGGEHQKFQQIQWAYQTLKESYAAHN